MADPLEAQAPKRPLRAAVTLTLILIERYGLDGKPPRSLEEVANRYHLSREEVRVLESRVLALFKTLVARATGKESS
jgi:DNA-directed RNA polymerase sigma subunit (sigma70/sigma32)